MASLQDQLNREAREHASLAAELEARRDGLRRQVKEKDESSSELKRQVNKLEAQNRTVQNEKGKLERVLQARDADRAKRREDVERWNAKLARTEEELQRLKAERERVQRAAEEKVDAARGKVAREQALMKSLDEEIKTKGSTIKKMEEERRRLQGDDSEENKVLCQIDRERDAMWERKLANLRSHYTSLIAVFHHAQTQYHEAQEHLHWVTTQRAAAASAAAVAAAAAAAATATASPTLGLTPASSSLGLALDAAATRPLVRTPVSSLRARRRHGGSFTDTGTNPAVPETSTAGPTSTSLFASPFAGGATNYLSFPA
ncbi:hypothetical protein KEM52_003983, partial [Ascosphaera acerosa]